MRIVAGIVAAIIVALMSIFLVELVGHNFFPVGSAATAISGPTGLLVMVVLALFIGAFAGGWIGSRIARSTVPAWVVAGLIVCVGIANMLAIPTPIWMAVASIVLPLFGAWLAQRLA